MPQSSTLGSIVRSVAFGAALILMAGLAACGGRSDGAAAGGAEIQLAVSEDPIRRFALWALENGKVEAEALDLQVSYLPVQSTQQAYQTRRYDVIEIAPVNLALAIEQGLETRILSSAIAEPSATVVHVPADSTITGPEQFRGKTIAIANTTANSTMLLRYALLKGYGLTSDIGGGDVTLQQIPPDAIIGLMRSGGVQGAVNLNRPRFLMEREGAFRPAFQVSKKVAELTGATPIQVVLATYPEVAQTKADALRRLTVALRASVAYALANTEEVAQAVDARNPGDAAYVRWWLDHSRLQYGELTPEQQAGLEAGWRVAHEIGVLTRVPAFAEVSLD